ncbi:MAG TPA: phosphatase PAP2 family protein [Thermoleophilaceae bacterium]|nr:phosphatase PAP2 family protein [Thermoleophilaceae bacterium]
MNRSVREIDGQVSTPLTRASRAGLGRRRLAAWLRSPRGRVAVSVAPLVVYLAFSGEVFARWSLWTSRDWIWVWLIGGLLVVSLTDLRGAVRGVVRDWLPFMAMILAYDLLRGVSDGLVPQAHSQFQIDFDRFLFDGHLPTIVLQRALYHIRHPAWYDYATWVVYSTHFLVTVLVAAVLWRVNRERFRRFRTRVATLAFAAIAFFAVYPTVPPWLADERGLIPQVRRIPLHISHDLGVHPVATVFEHGSHFANIVAALPSLHAAYPMLLFLFFWSSGWPVRMLLATYVVAMGIVVVYSGEHYVVDVLAGWLWAAGTMAGVAAAARGFGRLRTRLAARRAPAPVGTG